MYRLYHLYHGYVSNDFEDSPRSMPGTSGTNGTRSESIAMKTLLLTGIATLMVYSASAAQPQQATLPDIMIGTWCSGSISEAPIYVRGCDDGEG
jgi:hypothetical protein